MKKLGTKERPEWKAVQDAFADLTATEFVQMCSIFRDRIEKMITEAEDKIVRDQGMGREPNPHWLQLYTTFQKRAEALHTFAVTLSAEEFAEQLRDMGYFRKR